jgi:PAS domain S-box-containing protein
MHLWTAMTAWLGTFALASHRSSPSGGQVEAEDGPGDAAINGELAPPPTRLKTTLDMLQLQQAIIDNLPDAKVVIDDDGRIVLTNRQTELMFGYARDHMVGQPVEMLLPERLRDQHIGHRTLYNEDPRTRPMGIGGPLWGRHKSGREFRLEIMLAPIIIAAGGFVIAVIRRAPAARD